MKRVRAAFLAFAFAASVAAGEATNTVAETLQLSGIAGGLCVWLEPGSGDGVAELARGGKFLVHGIFSDTAPATELRQRLVDAGLSGFASVETLPLKALPHADNLVNLLVAEDLPALLEKGLLLTEVLRVLAPNSVACLGLTAEKKQAVETQLAQAGIQDARFVTKSRLWLVVRKPRPAGMDDWTHWNHGPDGNLVSHDRLIERPNQIQWICGQQWDSRRRNATPGSGHPRGVRSADGRNYYILGDDGPRGWSGGQLVARDAFSGVMLWQQRTNLNQRLVIASGNEVYLLRGGEIVALDGATGKDLRSYGKADGCRSLILAGDLLLSFETKSARAFDAATAKEKWSAPDGGSAGAPVVEAGNIFFTKGGLACLELATGAAKWSQPKTGDLLFAFNDMLLLRAATKGVKTKNGLHYTALLAKDGSEVWSYDCDRPTGAHSEAYFANGLIWIQGYDDRAKRETAGFHNPQGGVSYKWDGLDPKTGEVKRSFLAPVMLEYACHLRFVTDRFQIGIRPLYFTDWANEKVGRFEATRAACSSGAYGLGHGMFFGMYAESNLCMCIRQAISGVIAFTSDKKTFNGEAKTDEEGRLVAGTAAAPAEAPAPEDDVWPMYRHDMRRSARTATLAPRNLALAWQRKLLPAGKDDPNDAARGGVLANDWLLNRTAGDPITQPAVAGGKVFVSLSHAGQVVALHEQTGEIAWTFAAPSVIDAPPTIHAGLCLAGCHDGWVYCLRAGDGQLVWRFRAAPAERRVMAYGQVESAWPVVGGVLVVGNTAYVVAGRTTETDGGLYVHALDVKTGKVIWSERRVKPDDGPIGAWNLRGQKDTYFGPADVLCSDGRKVAIAGHDHGHFDCKTGGSGSERYSFGESRFGWMQSRYSWDNQGGEYAPRVLLGNRVVCPKTIQDKETKKSRSTVTMSGKAGWSAELPDQASVVEALVAAGVGAPAKPPPPPTVRVKSVKEPPLIDGALDDAFLQNATPLKFSMLDGTAAKPKDQTTGYLLCDAENLYLAFRCATANPDKLVCKKTQRDGDVWQDECLELFVDPLNNRGKKYFHIIVNPAGVTQESCAGDVSWNPALTVKCGKEPGQAWIAELKIPFSELGLKAGERGHVWSINLNRSARRAGDANFCEDTAWSPTYANSSHVPELFGYVWLDALQGARDDAAHAAWLKSIGHGAGAQATEAQPQGSGGMIVAALSSGKTGRLLVLSATDGSVAGALDLPSAPAFDGLAVAKGRVYVSLQDGTVACVTGK